MCAKPYYQLEKLTIMVNNTWNVSAYLGSVPTSATSDRKIKSGILYEKQQVIAILDASETAAIAWTRKCKSDLQNLSLEISDAAKLVREALEKGIYLGSEWCKQAPSGPWAACDAYRLNRDEWLPNAHRQMSFEYYIKFAIGKTGKILLLASCHLSQDRG